MFNRRSFLKVIPATLLPVGPNLAYGSSGGMDVSIPYQTVPLQNPPFRNEPLSEFISRYVGQADWLSASDHIINTNLKARPENYGKILSSGDRIPLIVNLPGQNINRACTTLDVILENRLPVAESFRHTAGVDEIITRTKGAVVLFPSPGQVTSVSINKFVFDVPGRIICVARFKNLTKNDPLKTKIYVAVSPIIFPFTLRPYKLVHSYEHALSECERLRNANWSASNSLVDIENYVATCKDAIRNE